MTAASASANAQTQTQTMCETECRLFAALRDGEAKGRRVATGVLARRAGIGVRHASGILRGWREAGLVERRDVRVPGCGTLAHWRLVRAGGGAA